MRFRATKLHLSHSGSNLSFRGDNRVGIRPFYSQQLHVEISSKLVASHCETLKAAAVTQSRPMSHLLQPRLSKLNVVPALIMKGLK